MSKDQANMIIVSDPLQLRKFDFPSKLKIYRSDSNLPTNVRKLVVVLDENLPFKKQTADVK